MDFEALREPFAKHEIQFRKGGQGRVFAYVDARAIADRLDTVCGPAHWQCDFKPGENGITLCGIGIHVEKSYPSTVAGEAGYDCWEWVWKWDGAGETQVEGEKGACSDAFRRAFYKWGCRYLYRLPSTVKGPNDMPAWALPGGCGFPPGNEEESTTQPTVESPDIDSDDPLNAKGLQRLIQLCSTTEAMDETMPELTKSKQMNVLTTNEIETIGNLWKQKYKVLQSKEK